MIILLAPVGSVIALGQTVGGPDVQVKAVKIDGKAVKISRKRFYLFRGGLEANRVLVDKLKAANVTSRDCFYCKMNASQAYIAWLKEKDCESPYCREITADDVAKVPEFQAAYQKGLKKYPGKTAIAQKWLTTNLEPALRDGFYLQRKSSLESLLGGLKPLQSSMTDTAGVRAMFVDIPLKIVAGKPTETYLISNLLPMEIGGKSYVWACEVEIGSTKKAALPLQLPEARKDDQEM